MSHRRKIAVIGLGYVGLPVAAALVGVTITVMVADPRQAASIASGHDNPYRGLYRSEERRVGKEC